MENWEDSRINEKKEILAYQLTELVHGKEEADKAQKSARDIFSGSGDSENMPTAEITSDDLFEDKIGIVKLVVKCGFASSNGEAKRLIQQNGITVNDQVVNALDKTYAKSELKEGLIVRKGKKHFKKAILG
jgi:tyrosyl-tRNA synthetase